MSGGLVGLVALCCTASPAWSASEILHFGPGARDWMGYAPVGDVNGDRLDDFAATVVAYPRGRVHVVFGRRAPDGVARRIETRGFLIETDTSWPMASGVGDVDGDGLDDVAVGTWDGTAVVFGKRDRETVHADDAGRRGFTVRGLQSSSRGGGNGIISGTGVVGVGDHDRNGAGDLAGITDGGVRVVSTPADPAGQVVDVRTAGTQVLRHSGGVFAVEAAGDLDHDGLTDLVAALDGPQGTPASVVFVRTPAGGAAVEPVEVATGGGDAATRLRFDGFRVLGDQTGDGRPEIAVEWLRSTDFQSGLFLHRRVVRGQDAGQHRDVAAMPGYDPQWLYQPARVGDMNGDGREDVGNGSTIHLTDDSMLQGGWPDWSTSYELWEDDDLVRTIVGSVRDFDGDGKPEVVLALSDRYDWSARGVEVRPSRDLRRANEQSGQAGGGSEPASWYGGGPPPASPEPPEAAVPRAAAGRGGPSELSATPAYNAGVVTLKVRAARGSRIEATGTARGWQAPAAGATSLPAASGPATLAQPWVELSVRLPPAARAGLERDGRLRMTLSTSSISPARRVTRRSFSFVVVARRSPPLVRGARRALRGSFGVQRLIGSSVADLLSGASGDDVLRAGGGPDALRGGTGNDTLLGEDGPDVLDGDDGDDDVHGGGGNDDLVEGRFGDDDLDGGPGDDVVYAGRGEDVVDGGPGDDVLAGGSGPDVVDCGPGEDVVFVNHNAERSKLTGCEHVWEEPGVVHVPCVDGGSEGPETVLGTEGDDVCVGFGGNDDLEGRGGHDRLDAGPGADRAFGRFGRDVLLGGEGNDELEGGRDEDRLEGGAGNDRLNGGYDADAVFGGPGADRIVARGGGVDRVDCGPGIDVAYVDSRDVVRGCERVHRSGSRRR